MHFCALFYEGQILSQLAKMGKTAHAEAFYRPDWLKKTSRAHYISGGLRKQRAMRIHESYETLCLCHNQMIIFKLIYSFQMKSIKQKMMYRVYVR